MSSKGPILEEEKYFQDRGHHDEKKGSNSKRLTLYQRVLSFSKLKEKYFQNDIFAEPSNKVKEKYLNYKIQYVFFSSMEKLYLLFKHGKLYDILAQFFM